MDRRTIWAILLMMVIAIAPAIFMKKPPVSGEAGKRGRSDRRSQLDSSAATLIAIAGQRFGCSARRPATPPQADTLPRRPAAPLTRLAPKARRRHRPRHLAPLHLRHQHPRRPAGRGDALALSLDGAGQQGQPRAAPPARQPAAGPDAGPGPGHHPAARLAVHRRRPRASTSRARRALTLSGERDGSTVDLTYTFSPDDYQIDVEGRVTGVGPNGGLLRVGMGPTIANTEADFEREPARARAGHQAQRDRAHRFLGSQTGRAQDA